MRNKRPKRLCILMPGHWSRGMGGSQYQAKCIIEELQKIGRYEIVYLSRDCLPSYRPKGYRLVQYGFPGARKRGIHRILFEWPAISRALKQIAPHVIYQRVGSAQTGFAAHYALRNRCKMVWHIAHENELEPYRIEWSRLLLYRMLDRLILNYGIKHAACVIAQTEDQKILLEKNFSRRDALVIPNFHPAPTNLMNKKDPIKIVWVANLKRIKQPEIFIRLAADLRELPNAQFIMVGAMQGAGRLRQKYTELIGRTPGLEYLGAKTQEEVNTLLSDAHIFVNTSQKEGFPNTFIQAWLRQVPVVSLQVDPDRLIQKHRLGFVCESFNKLKENVALLIADGELRCKMGDKARTFAYKHFSPGNASKIDSVFENLV